MPNNIILQHNGKNNSSILLYKNKSNEICIDLNTSKSSFLCPECNSTSSRKCKCKDKDYIQGCWNGFLLSDENNNIMYNIYDFIKNNMDEISEYNRIDLHSFFISNNDIFLKKYYSTLYQELESFFENNKIIFTDEFHELIKENYINLIDKDNEDNLYIVNFLSNKENFKYYFLVDKIEMYNTYKHYDLQKLLKDDPNELFNEIKSISNIYMKILYKFEMLNF